MDKQKYHKVNSQDYFANPQKYEALEEALGSDCMPVGIYGGFISQKGEADIMEKTQFNIRDRFGYSDEVDQ